MNEHENKNEKDCTDQLTECHVSCDPDDKECIEECIDEYHACEAPFDTPAYQNYKEQMTSEEDKFMKMDEGELISECLQIAALLNGTCERITTVNSTGRKSKKIIIEYDVTNE